MILPNPTRSKATNAHTFSGATGLTGATYELRTETEDRFEQVDQYIDEVLEAAVMDDLDRRSEIDQLRDNIIGLTIAGYLILAGLIITTVWL